MVWACGAGATLAGGPVEPLSQTVASLMALCGGAPGAPFLPVILRTPRPVGMES